MFSDCGKNANIPKCVPSPPFSCGDKNITEYTHKCKLNYNSRCYCKSGFLRNNEGVCIREAECGNWKHIPKSTKRFIDFGFFRFSECEENEYIPKCVPCSPLKCGDMNDNSFCPKNCQKNNQCYCKPGFLRNKEDNCVTKEECGRSIY